MLSRIFAPLLLILWPVALPFQSALAMATTAGPKQVCIVGAGPAGLYLAHLLLQQDETVKVDILEKAPQDGTPDANAFGFGVGARHQRCLEQIPGLWPRIEDHSAPATGGPPVRIIGRNVLCRELLDKLEEMDSDKRCTVSYDTGCQSIDLDQHVVTTSQGKQMHYDLLVGCDGVNSMVRDLLVETKGMQEEHYLRNSLWKSLKIPKQSASVLDPGAFKPLSHPSLNGAIIPRYPEGHTALIFWRDLDLNNPKGIETRTDLAKAITQAVQPKASKWDFARKLMFLRVADNSTDSNAEIQVQFDNQDLDRFVQSYPRREHYLKLDRYHDAPSRVALVGDAAHGMYSFLGQGAACAFQSANLLATSINHNKDIPKALEEYSNKAVPEGHAANDLNLLTHAIFGSLFAKLLAIPLLLLNTLRGKLLMTRLNEDVTYRQIYNENTLLVRVSRYFWRKHRISFSKARAV